MQARGENRVPGDVIFKLYDTYGFPVDIVRDVVRDEDITLDMEGFEEHMAAQRAKSRSKISFDGISDAYKNLTATGVKSEFVGYAQTEAESEVLLLVQDGAEVEQAASDVVEIVTGTTPFYGESGGQVGDSGTITASGLEVKVTDTVKDPTGLIIHRGELVSGQIAKGQAVALHVDAEARRATECNHTATHVLHTSLRQVLGDHVKQAGSLVAPDRFRFDFTHFSQVTPAQIEQIETIANRYIRENNPTAIQEMAAEEAFKSGATALFEEKYGDTVRVVSLGDFSRELCGGTHTDRTGNIGLLKIVGESSIASGVRRIEALTGAGAVAHVQKMVGILNEGARLLKDKPEAVVPRIEKLIADYKAGEKKVEQLKAKMASQAADAVADIRTVNGVKILAQKVAVDSPAALRDMADKFKDSLKSGVVVLGAESDNKALLIVGVTKDLTGQYKAGNIIKEVAAIVGGSGGGRPDMAQAGGSQPEKLDEALEKAYGIVEAMVS